MKKCKILKNEKLYGQPFSDKEIAYTEIIEI